MSLLGAFQLVASIWALAEIGMAIWKRSTAPADRARDRGSMLLVFGVVAGSLVTAHLATSASWATLPMGSRQALWVGLVMLLAGMSIRWTAVISLGRFFTMNVAIHEEHMVVREGLYSVVRHPSYTGLLVSFAGIGIALDNWISLAALTIPITGALLYRIRVEEAVLLQSLGEEYGQYCLSTRRLIPFLY